METEAVLSPSLEIGGTAAMKTSKTSSGKQNSVQQQSGASQPQRSRKKSEDQVDNSAKVDESFVTTVQKEAEKVEGSMKSKHSSKSHSKKKMKKGIFVSYSPDVEFVERRFVAETVKQLKENNLAEDLWFDKDEQNTDSPCWFSMRMEAVERCRAAVVFLSDSYFSCPVSIYEGKALLERRRTEPESVKVYPVLFTLSPQTEVPRVFESLLQKAVDLTKAEHQKQSLAERSSVVVGALMTDLEKHASVLAPPTIVASPDTEFTGEYAKKKICRWSVTDLQEWLFKLGIKEFYRQSLAESGVDGFLLMSLTDQDMIQHLGVDSRAVRKKIMQQILATLDKENKLADNWHLRARTQRPKSGTVYLVYDPVDVRLAQLLKQDLCRKNLQVIHHQKLGQSKEEFLQLNSSLLATATHILVLLTEGATNSPFVYHETLFADWLGKKLVTVMFKNTWGDLRPSLKAVLGDCPAVDFETQLYTESLSILEHHLKPLRTVPGVILEQSYLNKMADGIQPLAMLADNQHGLEKLQGEQQNKVFISYQWDMQSKVEDIRRHLENNGFGCWVDINPTMASHQQRGNSSVSSRSGAGTGGATESAANAETLQSQIQRNMKAANVVLCCVTPKYMQSESCIKDLSLAEILHKSIVPVMLRFCPWPPEGAPPQVRKILVKHTPVDLSNDKLFKQNIPALVDRVKKAASQKKH